MSVETIHKYLLSGEAHQVVSMPASAQILSAQIQGDKICLWAQHPKDAPLAKRVIHVVGTGWDLPASASRYIGTVQEGFLVWHIYEGGPLVAERAAVAGNAVLSEALLSLEARLMEIQPIPEDQPKQDRLSADLRASAQISRCSEQREASLLADNAALRRHLQAIADQGTHFGPDGTFATWRHWTDLAKDALAQIPART